MEKQYDSLKKENLILKVVCGALLIAGVGLYIYGYLQKDFALAKQEEALTVKIKLIECEIAVKKQTEIAAKAEIEMWNHKQLLNECYEKWREDKSNKK